MDRRHELTAVVALALALVAGAGVASAASPAPTITITEPTPIPGTIGAEVRPADLNVDEAREVSVRNRAGLVMDFTITTTGGYVIEPTAFTLPPDGVQVVTVGETGEGEGRMTLVGTTSAVALGQVAASIALETKLRHGQGVGSWLLAVFITTAITTAWGALYRRRQRQMRSTQ